MAKINLYTEEQNAFLQGIKGKDTYKNIAEKFNAKFGTSITQEAICRKIARGLYVSHVPKYTQEQEDFLRKQSQIYSLAKVKADFKVKYGMDITKQAITDRRRRVYHTAPTEFKAKQDYKHYWCESPIGSESIKEGEITVKVSENTWKYKHWHIWEQHYGRVPKGNRVIFLDGNNRNFDINNLACVPLKYICLLANSRWKLENAELTKSAIKWCELYYALKG